MFFDVEDELVARRADDDVTEIGAGGSIRNVGSPPGPRTVLVDERRLEPVLGDREVRRDRAGSRTA